MRLRSIVLSLAVVAFAAPPALAQGAAPTMPLSPPVPAAAPNDAAKLPVSLSAVFAGEPKPIRSGLVWRVFEERTDAGPPALVEKSSNAAATFSLKPGNYIVHAAYGFAGASKRISVQSREVGERL